MAAATAALGSSQIWGASLSPWLCCCPQPCCQAHSCTPFFPCLPHSILPLEAAGATIERNIRELLARNYEVGAGWGGCSVSCASTQVAVELFLSVLSWQPHNSLFLWVCPCALPLPDVHKGLPLEQPC